MSPELDRVLEALEAELDAIEIEMAAFLKENRVSDHAQLTALSARTDSILRIIDRLLDDDLEELEQVSNYLRG